jgi:anaerobic selenocysteine-containing dehydrogenase
MAVAETMFQAVLDHPEGLFLGRMELGENMKEIRTPDGRINLFIPEMEKWVQAITPEAEEKALAPDPEYPLVLHAGRHIRFNANTLMRNPEWNKGFRYCTLAMNPADAERLGLADGQTVRVVTSAGREEIELEVTGQARPGQVIMPHGFGLKYRGKKYGANVNRLTKNTHRDPIAGTPLHRYVPCRVEPL